MEKTDTEIQEAANSEHDEPGPVKSIPQNVEAAPSEFWNTLGIAKVIPALPDTPRRSLRDLAGIYKDNPHFDRVVEEIHRNREALDHEDAAATAAAL